MVRYLKAASIILTGSHGYVGTATKELLESSGYKVIKVDKKIGRNTIYLFSYIINESPIGIIHLSAKKSITESKKKPLSYYINNLLSTLSVAVVSKALSIPVVFASSASVYTPYNAYARGKRWEEKMLNSMSHSFAILRYFNIVGKTDTVNHHGSDNLFEIIKRNPKIEINSVTSTRDYVHVLDVARANLMAIEHLQNNNSFITDIFTGEFRTVMDVIEEYRSNGLIVEYTVLGKHDESPIPVLDNRAKFGWEPVYTFKQAIQSEIKRPLALKANSCYNMEGGKNDN